MSSNKDEDKAYPFIIPANYHNQFHFMNRPYEYKFVLQTGILTISATLLMWFGLIKVFSTVTALSVIIFADALIIIFSMNGIQGDTFIGFLLKVLRYKKRRRVAYYNPRVKKEADPGFTKEHELLPREKLMNLYNIYKKNFDEKHQRNAEAAVSDELKHEVLFFQDDIGIVDKPYEYMTRKERRDYERNQKKMKEKIDV